MAKRNKIKRRARYHKGTRHDYRGGGRVALQRGGLREEEEELMRQVQTGGRQARAVDIPRELPPQGLPSIEEAVASSGRVPSQYSVDPKDDRGSFDPQNPFNKPEGLPPILPPDQIPPSIVRPSPSIKNPPVNTIPVDALYDEPVETEPGEQDIGVRNPIGTGPVSGNPEVINEVNAPTTNAAGEVVVAPSGNEQQPPLFVTPTLPLERLKKKEKRPSFRDLVSDAARGITPEATKIPDAVQVEEGIPQEVTEMAQPTGVGVREAAQVSPEQVARGDAQQAQTPEQIRAAQMEADKVDTQAQVDVATGTVSDEAIAEAAGVDRVPTIEAAEVEIPVGALTDRVTGTLSEEAKSVAAQNTGSSLRKLSRAKKQLRKAGLTEDQIGEIGDDIESLEDRLDDFTEEQRGLIAGVDKDTLVDAQMGRLLDGMEEGQIPLWAQGAVGQVEQMLAARGLSASSVGKASLTSAILQSALPMAQSNATALQQAATQQRDIEAKESEANAQRRQQTALTNASTVFQMDMAQFSSDQQIALSNSKFLQTVALTNASMQQQGIMQDAIMMSQANLTEAGFNQQAQIQNAQSFLQMDLTNLSNEQQGNVLRAQQTQQRLLSNQASENAARNANMVSENQTQQFMASLKSQVDQYNTTQTNAMEQFNATQQNAATARDSQREADVNKFNTQLATQIDQFNANQDFAYNQWTAQNSAAVEASNVQWRRQTNVANTAAQNAVNMQNAQNSFAMSQTAMSFLWQELRDKADYDFREGENEKNRISQLVNTALASDPSKYNSSLGNLQNLIKLISGDLTGATGSLTGNLSPRTPGI